jgi:hypothetical protein
MVASSFVIATTYILPTFQEPIIYPFGYNSHDATIYGVLYNLMGVVGGLMFAVILMKWQQFKVACFVFTIATLVLSFLLKTGLESEWSKGLVGTLNTLNGFFAISSFSVVYEWAVDITPEVDEAVTAGLMNMSANMFALGEILLIQTINASYHDEPKEILVIMMNVFYVTLIIALVLYAFVFKNEKRDRRASTVWGD